MRNYFQQDNSQLKANVMNFYFIIFERTYSYLVRVAWKKEYDLESTRAFLVCSLLPQPFLFIIMAALIAVKSYHTTNFQLDVNWSIAYYLIAFGINALIFLWKKRYLDLAIKVRSFSAEKRKKWGTITILFWIVPVFILFVSLGLTH